MPLQVAMPDMVLIHSSERKFYMRLLGSMKELLPLYEKENGAKAHNINQSSY